MGYLLYVTLIDYRVHAWFKMSQENMKLNDVVGGHVSHLVI